MLLFFALSLPFLPLIFTSQTQIEFYYLFQKFKKRQRYKVNDPERRK